ncbi:DUF6086 family protein [Micromonospora chaiyaphumensis]|uniref:Uncharacterized protein n=1 Tax=Micromonospora chaiyaphumensis TaxID=307119 RepID=A0A1C4ZMS6_9ACTN|nr:DUF6086 family protein [Micromonospora chaiyaphumensis]SCF34303.1 hypothetical protein GA0070214_1188 [Micromonospora chaiyaphumensis]
MSQYFQVGRTVLWNPSNGVAQLFARNVEAVAGAVEVPTGIAPEVNDEYEIDLVAFTAFVDALVRRYRSSTHRILRALIEDVAALGIVMVERGGGTVAALAEPASAFDPRDVAVLTTGFGATGDPRRLRELADELTRHMAC